MWGAGSFVSDAADGIALFKETNVKLAEQLETRRLLTAFTASTVAELISNMNAANATPGQNTITLAPGAAFTLNAVDNFTFSANGLPAVAAGNDLTIEGNGDAIERGTGRSTPAFRLLAVANLGSLTLNHLTLSQGLAAASGGAIFNLGTLTLDGVTVQNCTAQAAGPSGVASGGGIYSDGVVSIANSTIRNNQALGGNGTDVANGLGGGAAAHGGGMYVGTATVTNTTFSSNLARGGDGASGFIVKGKEGTFIYGGGWGGDATGGAIYSRGAIELRGAVITQNTAKGGVGGNTPKGWGKAPDGVGQGGGIYIAPGVAAGLDAFTQANTKNNTASTSDNDIFGSFTILA
jgi:hypothetical protein